MTVAPPSLTKYEEGVLKVTQLPTRPKTGRAGPAGASRSRTAALLPLTGPGRLPQAFDRQRVTTGAAGARKSVRSESGRTRTPRGSVTGGNATSLPIEAWPGDRWSQFPRRSGDHKVHIIPGQVVVRGRIELPTFRFSGGRSYRLSYLTSAGPAVADDGP
jgi:hypothetical protein